MTIWDFLDKHDWVVPLLVIHATIIAVAVCAAFTR